jgi:hypothetical protein
MSIDLLPREEGRRRQLRRRAAIATLLLVTVWAALLAAQLAELAVVDDRLAERDAAAARAAELEAQVASLTVFQRMADDAASGNRLLAHAMADEVSWAQLLVDLSRGVPETASFTQINGQLADADLVTPTGAPTGGDVFVLTDAADVGFFTISGYSREVFTPGLQDLLRRFGAIDGFFQQYLTSAQVDAIGDVPVTTFAAEVRLDDSARTDRYADGLPGRSG